jgi:hypothetical protein
MARWQHRRRMKGDSTAFTAEGAEGAEIRGGIQVFSAVLCVLRASAVNELGFHFSTVLFLAALAVVPDVAGNFLPLNCR